MLITMFYFFVKLKPVGVTSVEKRLVERESFWCPHAPPDLQNVVLKAIERGKKQVSQEQRMSQNLMFSSVFLGGALSEAKTQVPC